MTENPGNAEKGKRDNPVYLFEIDPQKAVEDGLGAAHRGIFILRL